MRITVVLALLVPLALLAARLWAADWPQLQNGPLRPGYSDEKLTLPLRRAWSVSFVPERIYPANQPIAYSGRVYIGTQSGKLHALDAKTGRRDWAAEGFGPILGPAAADDGKVFFASLDANVYAIAADSGERAWTFRSGLDTGFSSAVTLADGRLYAVNRGGMVFALNPKDGSEIWRRDLGVPVLLSPAVRPKTDDKPGMLYVGASDMRVYAVDTTSGATAWKSQRLAGQLFKDYWPVVVGDKVIVRSMIAYVKPDISNRVRRYSHENFPLTWADPRPDPAWGYDTPELKQQAMADGAWYVAHSDEVARGEIPEEVDAAQARLVEHYRQHPEDRDLFVLDAETGTETLVTPHWCAQTMNGPTSPPCVDRDGMLIVPMMYINSRWGRFDLATNRVVDILYDGRTMDGRKITEIEKAGYYAMAGGGNTDENMIVSAAGDLIFSFHCQESNANHTGVWDMKARRWQTLAGPGDRSGGAFFNNTQGGGTSAAIVSDGMLFHMSYNRITAWRSGAQGGGR